MTANMSDPRKGLTKVWYATVSNFCETFLEENEGELELDRLIDAVEISTGLYTPFLVERWLYENKYPVTDGIINGIDLDFFE